MWPAGAITTRAEGTLANKCTGHDQEGVSTARITCDKVVYGLLLSSKTCSFVCRYELEEDPEVCDAMEHIAQRFLMASAEVDDGSSQALAV